jgi:RecB family exonuclease
MYFFPTTIDKYRRCPFSYWGYRNRKDLEKKFVPNKKTWVGQVAHYFMEKVFGASVEDEPTRLRIWEKAWKGYLRQKMDPKGYWDSEQEEQRDFESFFFLLQSFLEDHPRLLELEVLGVEQFWHADYPSAPLGIRADLVGRYPDGTITVLDWKSGKKPFFDKLPKFLENDSQMPVSALVAAHVFKITNPMVEIFYLFADFEHRAQFDEASLKGWEEYYRRLIARINSETEWPAQKNKLCDWCATKAICPAHGNADKRRPS